MAFVEKTGSSTGTRNKGGARFTCQDIICKEKKRLFLAEGSKMMKM